MPVLPVRTVVELVRERARLEPDRVGYTFLAFHPSARPAAVLDGEADARDRTYAQLDRRARAVAAWLQANVARGDRVLLLFEEGLEYLDALFGAMLAGALAVPVHPPDPKRLQRTLPRLLNVSKDAGVSAVL